MVKCALYLGWHHHHHHTTLNQAVVTTVLLCIDILRVTIYTLSAYPVLVSEQKNMPGRSTN